MEAYLSLNPNDAYDCNKLGALYLQIGQVKQGIKLLKKGLKSNRAEIPVLFELHYHLGNAYFRQGETELAAKHYQKALGLPVLPQLKIAAYNNFGGLLKEMGNLALAKQAYEKTLAIDPNFIEGHNNLGMTFRAMGRYKEALSCYHQAISLAPNRPDLYQNLGVAWLKAGYVQESLGAFKKAIQLHQKSDPQEAQRLRQNLQEMGFPLE
jgi:tetratricopeptide (TPR) repeat protein